MFVVGGRVNLDASVDGVARVASTNSGQVEAVAWGYGRGADKRGVEIHQNTEVLGIETEETDSGRRVIGVRTSRGRIETRKVLCAVAGSTPRMLDMVGLTSAQFRQVRSPSL